MTENHETNKTTIIKYCIICFTALAGFALHVFTRPDSQTSNSSTTDKFTYCLQVAMSESRQSGKVITANEARDICLNAGGMKVSKCDKAS